VDNTRPTREHQQAQTYLNLANVIFVAMDAAGDVTLVNRKACEMLGYSEDQIIGKNWFDTCLPEENIAEIKGVFQKIVLGDNFNHIAYRRYEGISCLG